MLNKKTACHSIEITIITYLPMKKRDKLIYETPTLNVREMATKGFLCQSGGDIEGIEIEDWTLE